MNKFISYIFLFSILMGCQNKAEKTTLLQAGKQPEVQGKLFIIGGGKRPVSLIQSLIKEANISQEDSIAILPLSSSEPDTAFFYAKKQFVELGITNVHNFYAGDTLPTAEVLQTLKSYPLIYLSGGDQNRFMERIQGSNLKNILQEAYQKGSTIAGTSAGAALMSEQMITGNEKNYSEYRSTPAAIEKDNIELAEGLGFLPQAIIDQHFVARSRYNRIISTAIEYPQLHSIGIDESTAICISKGNQAKVYGKAQVVCISNPSNAKATTGNKLGARGLKLDIYLPGDTFELLRQLVPLVE
ncbi:cyanophycinase [Algivirga pacifica]|uniref:Cyanophycinase n=1 Tax=Algivirga pacifica TaxID=1162670 RepID=A0ABP9D7M6_9BACT